MEKELIFSQREIESMAAQIGLSQLNYDNPDLYKEQLVYLNQLTVEDIVEIAKEYFYERKPDRGVYCPGEGITKKG